MDEESNRFVICLDATTESQRMGIFCGWLSRLWKGIIWELVTMARTQKVISVYGFPNFLVSWHSYKSSIPSWTILICFSSALLLGQTSFICYIPIGLTVFYNLASNYFWNFLETSDRGDLSRERRQCLLCGWKLRFPDLAGHKITWGALLLLLLFNNYPFLGSMPTLRICFRSSGVGPPNLYF